MTFTVRKYCNYHKNIGNVRWIGVDNVCKLYQQFTQHNDEPLYADYAKITKKQQQQQKTS